MAILYLTEDDVRQVLTMEMALEAVETGLKKLSLDEAINVPRTRCQTDHAMLHIMSAAGKTLGVMGFKAYVTTKRGMTFQFHLFDGRSGEPLAWMQADYLGQVRTGAASGVATKYLARADAATVGIFGSGKQARTQLEAMCKVRRIKRAHVYSLNADNRKAFAAEMSRRCGTQVVPVTSPEHAAKGMDVICTATSSRDPVLAGEWLADGTHINAIGANFLSKAELDLAAVKRATKIVVDSKDQARLEAGDLLRPLEEGVIHWANIGELANLVAGRVPGRENPQEVTLFKSLGLAIEDVATGAKVYALAKAKGVGRILNL